MPLPELCRVLPQIGTPNPESASLLEGNLTYYAKSADGTIVDSVGVAPSTPIRQAVIPFDDFQAVALALANLNTANLAINLTLFDDRNTQMGTATQVLANNQQVARFLYQFFQGVSLTKGRVEIQSAGAFIGTALTFKGGQWSALPFLPSMKLYDITLNVAGNTETVQLYLTIDGAYVTGYSVDVVNGVPQPAPGSIEQITGTLLGGNLELLLHTHNGDDVIIYVLFPGFNPLLHTQNGTVLIYSVNPPGVAGQGTITATAR